VGRDQCGQPLDELQGRQVQFDVPIEPQLGKAIDQLVVADVLEPLQGEGRPSTVAQQLLRLSSMAMRYRPKD
jgi:hypothetical protein